MTPANILGRLAAAAAAATSGLSLVTIQPGFSNTTLEKVRTNLGQIANASWEIGTQAEALTEYRWPELSVFSRKAFPPSPQSLNATYNATDVLRIANETVSKKAQGAMTLVADGAVGDPASLGPVVLLANWTKTDLSDVRYSTAAGQQLDFLLNYAPRTQSGAISHREDMPQLWADFVYMAPPFIAYFGALQGGQAEINLGQIAYDQIALYRDGLRDADSGLWRHIAQGTWQDDTHWATGNAWAAAGMLRVHQALAHGAQSSQFVSHRRNLTEWIEEIVESSWKHQTEDGALRNVIDNSTSFVDAASTALMAASTYRLAVIQNTTTFVPQANLALKFVQDNINDDGWLLNTVDPITFHTQSKAGEYSPEGQAFVLLLHAAWRDLVAVLGDRVFTSG